jgi:predicted dehydrogenase
MTFGAIGAGGHMLDGHIIPGAAVGLPVSLVFDPKLEAIESLVAHEAVMPTTTATTSFEKFLEYSRKVDAIVIASPDRFHARQFLDVIQHLVENRQKKPVLIDKPLAITEADLDLVKVALRLAQREGIPVTSCLVRYFDPPYVWLAENIAWISETIGNLRHIALNFSYPAPSASWKLDGRSLMYDHAIHELHVLISMLFPNLEFDVDLRTDGPQFYQARGSIGREDTFLTFSLRGDRLQPRPATGRGLFHETIAVQGERGHCELDTHLGDITMRAPNEVFRVRTGATHYDHRLQGVMGNLRDMIDGKPSYVSPKELLLLTEATIALDRDKTFSYRP